MNGGTIHEKDCLQSRWYLCWRSVPRARWRQRISPWELAEPPVHTMRWAPRLPRCGWQTSRIWTSPPSPRTLPRTTSSLSTTGRWISPPSRTTPPTTPIRVNCMDDGEVYDGFYAIGSLYPEAVQLMVAADSDITDVSQLKGLNVSVGSAGSRHPDQRRAASRKPRD